MKRKLGVIIMLAISVVIVIAFGGCSKGAGTPAELYLKYFDSIVNDDVDKFISCFYVSKAESDKQKENINASFKTIQELLKSNSDSETSLQLIDYNYVQKASGSTKDYESKFDNASLQAVEFGTVSGKISVIVDNVELASIPLNILLPTTASYLVDTVWYLLF